MKIIAIASALSVITASAIDVSFIGSPLNPQDALLQMVLHQSSDEIGAALAFIDRMEHPCNWEIEYPIVASILRENNLKIGVEIGVAYGGQSEYLLKNTQVTKLFSIDPYRHFDIGYHDVMNFEQPVFDVLHIKTLKRLEPYGDRSEFIRMPSTQAAYIFSEESLDFVYIDGNHSYDAVRDDIRAWYEKVRSGGILMGDDYSWSFPGLCQAVDEFCAREGLQFHKTGIKWWVVKP